MPNQQHVDVSSAVYMQVLCVHRTTLYASDK